MVLIPKQDKKQPITFFRKENVEPEKNHFKKRGLRKQIYIPHDNKNFSRKIY